MNFKTSDLLLFLAIMAAALFILGTERGRPAPHAPRCEMCGSAMHNSRGGLPPLTPRR